MDRPAAGSTGTKDGQQPADATQLTAERVQHALVPAKPVTIENDVNLAAMAERAVGAAAGMDDFVLVWIGVGLGLATILGGRSQGVGRQPPSEVQGLLSIGRRTGRPVSSAARIWPIAGRESRALSLSPGNSSASLLIPDAATAGLAQGPRS